MSPQASSSSSRSPSLIFEIRVSSTLFLHSPSFAFGLFFRQRKVRERIKEQREELQDTSPIREEGKKKKLAGNNTCSGIHLFCVSSLLPVFLCPFLCVSSLLSIPFNVHFSNTFDPSFFVFFFFVLLLLPPFSLKLFFSPLPAPLLFV